MFLPVDAKNKGQLMFKFGQQRYVTPNDVIALSHEQMSHRLAIKRSTNRFWSFSDISDDKNLWDVYLFTEEVSLENDTHAWKISNFSILAPLFFLHQRTLPA